jgi:hypothetical protein
VQDEVVSEHEEEDGATGQAKTFDTH